MGTKSGLSILIGVLNLLYARYIQLPQEICINITIQRVRRTNDYNVYSD